MRWSAMSTAYASPLREDKLAQAPLGDVHKPLPPGTPQTFYSSSENFSPQLTSPAEPPAQVLISISELGGESRKIVENALSLYAPHVSAQRAVEAGYSAYAWYESPWIRLSGRGCITTAFKVFKLPWSSANLSVRAVRVSLANGGQHSIFAIPMSLRLFARGRSWLRALKLYESVKLRLTATLVVDNTTNRVVSHVTSWEGLSGHWQVPWIAKQWFGCGALIGCMIMGASS